MVIVGVLLSVADIASNNLNWSNGTDAVMSGVALIPGVGWVLGAAYFIADPLVKNMTGKSIGEHVGETVEATPSVGSKIWNMLLSGVLNVGSALRKGWVPR